MNQQKWVTPYVVILGLVVAGCLMISPTVQAGETPSGGSEEVNQLLAEFKTEARELESDADELALWTRSPHVSWQSHAQKISLITEHVNQAGKILAEMDKVRLTASPWQQGAIDRIYPMLKEMADNTNTIIDHFTDHKSHTYLPPYTDYAQANYELARDLAALIGDYVDYGEHEAIFLGLQEKLQAAQ